MRFRKIPFITFVTQMGEKGLETEKQKLAREFREANQDSERNAEIEIWNTINELDEER